MSTPERPKKIQGDRFIPCTVRRALFQTKEDNCAEKDDLGGVYTQALRAELFGETAQSVFSYSAPAAAPATPHSNAISGCSGTSTPGASDSSPMSCDTEMAVPNTPPRPTSSTPKAIASPGYLPRRLDYPVSPCRSPGNELKGGRQRKVNPSPVRILDAPGLVDNFYIDVLDFGANNHLLVALGATAYLWNAETFQISSLTTVPDTYISAVRWLDNNMAALGTATGQVLLVDAAQCQTVQTMQSHTDRVGCLSWNSALGVLASGSRDTRVLLSDSRSGAVQEYTHHTDEVCGVRWAPDGQCLSSGGNDNQLCVWSAGLAAKPLLQAQLQAAVRAMAWSPHAHGLLACGGGSADRHIHFYNSVAGTTLADVDTGAQVCNLLWAPHVNELVSTHGYQHSNILLWKYPRLTTVATLSGHTSRVLWLAGSPDGQTIVTGAADETLRFWEVFPPARPPPSTSRGSLLSMSIALSTLR